jgi:hypothetical protein
MSPAVTEIQLTLLELNIFENGTHKPIKSNCGMEHKECVHKLLPARQTKSASYRYVNVSSPHDFNYFDDNIDSCK